MEVNLTRSATARPSGEVDRLATRENPDPYPSMPKFVPPPGQTSARAVVSPGRNT
jgi:hypothetical protein